MGTCSSYYDGPQDVPNTIKKNRDFERTADQEDFSNPVLIDNIWRVYKKCAVLGRGGYGKVYLAMRRDNEQFFAIKKMKRTVERAFLREMGVLSVLNHENIIKVQRTWKDSKNFYCVMKLCTGGSILEKVKRENFLSERLVAEIMCQVVSGLSHAHQQNIVHCDIKPENIVFDVQDSNTPILVDWGSALRLGPNDITTSTSSTLHYCPPEQSTKRLPEAMKKADMWSIGVTAYVLLVGALPFQGKTLDELKKNIRKLNVKFPERMRISEDARKFISGCLKKRVASRLSADEALEMPFLLRASAQSDENIMYLMTQHLEDLAHASKLQKLLINIRVGGLDPIEKKRLKYLFERLDKEGTGVISKAQLAESLREADPDVSENQAKERAAALFEAAGCMKKGMSLKDFARAQVANEVLTFDGMQTMFRSLSKSQSSSRIAVQSRDIERLYSETFNRKLTPTESATLDSEWRSSFGGRETVSEHDFLGYMGFGDSLKEDEPEDLDGVLIQVGQGDEPGESSSDFLIDSDHDSDIPSDYEYEESKDDGPELSVSMSRSRFKRPVNQIRAAQLALGEPSHTHSTFQHALWGPKMGAYGDIGPGVVG